MLLVISNGDEGIKKLKKYADLGFTEIVLTNSRANR
jgi:coenzyme F420-dependent glucose-6-phosphate dehydrogenase